MVEYETFAYLALQKTGSTFIVEFLRQFCSETLVCLEKHQPVPPERFDREKLYIISVRDPLDQYVSLYSFGVGGKGKLFNAMRRRGYDFLYDGTPEGFRNWLKFILRPGNANLIAPDYSEMCGGEMPAIIGYQSFRYLRLAVPSTEEVFADAKDENDVRTIFKQNNIVGFVIRNERLNQDLATLVQTRLRNSIRDLDAALTHLQTSERRNSSSRVEGAGTDLGEKLKKRLQSREWLLHELFDY